MPRFFCFGIDPLGELRAGGGHVDGHRSGLGICQDAILSKVELLYIFRKSDHCDDNIFLGGAGGDTVTPHGPFLDDIKDLGLGPAVDRDRVPSFHQIAHHRLAHYTDTNESDRFHIDSTPFAIWLFYLHYSGFPGK